ncbi:hypothetical protein GCM10009733_070110 [Nonomuraea maheshkhaliensis]|uniref:MarR family transcriptional regulator n=1 Tax=Nonomuraea maheshkhaliensis TaxID=419590 RepID=A0ABN2FZ56_9ACTN
MAVLAGEELDSASDDALRLQLTQRGQRYVLTARRTADGGLQIELNGRDADGGQVAELSGHLPAADLGLLVDLVKLLKGRCGQGNESTGSLVEQQKLVHAAAYRGWSDEQDDELRQLASQPGASVKAIAAALERSEGAIRSRLRRLRDRDAAAPDGDRAISGAVKAPDDELAAE